MAGEDKQAVLVSAEQKRLQEEREGSLARLKVKLQAEAHSAEATMQEETERAEAAKASRRREKQSRINEFKQELPRLEVCFTCFTGSQLRFAPRNRD